LKKLIIFDWDGTLCDSLGRIAECLAAAARERGLAPPSLEAGRNVVGLSLPRALAELFPGLDEPELEQLDTCYRRHFVERDAEPSAFFPSVLEVLEKLKARGYRLAVATGKSRKGLTRALAAHGLTNFFDSSRCADESLSKPHPAMLRELLLEFQVEPGESMMVGDSEYDMEMARRAEVPRIGVSYGAHGADRLKRFELVACLNTFPEIFNHI
jgi:phosphoglycolate phosphatase